jgi:hypothetical protein
MSPHQPTHRNMMGAIGEVGKTSPSRTRAAVWYNNEVPQHACTPHICQCRVTTISSAPPLLSDDRLT